VTVIIPHGIDSRLSIAPAFRQLYDVAELKWADNRHCPGYSRMCL